MIEAVALTVAIGALVSVGIFFAELFGGGNQTAPAPEAVRDKVNLNDYEKKMAARTTEIMIEELGEDPIKTLADASNTERIALTDKFAKRLAQEYGLDDIDVDIYLDNQNAWGFYNWGNKQFRFNISTLMIDKDNPQFERVATEVLDTIAHELAHAVQHRCIENPGFWEIDDERRKKFADNMKNYIKPSTDYKGYCLQPVEAHAVVFADLAIKEYIRNRKAA